MTPVSNIPCWFLENWETSKSGTLQVHIVVDSKLPQLSVDHYSLHVVHLVWSYVHFPKAQWICKRRSLMITQNTYVWNTEWVQQLGYFFFLIVVYSLKAGLSRGHWIEMLLKISPSLFECFHSIVVIKHLHTSQLRSGLWELKRSQRLIITIS